MSNRNDVPAPYGPVPSPRQLKWHELETYAFVHFTTNTFTDKEWGYGDESPSLFNPTQFSARQIVTTLKAAGLKAVILTCKHHDGFCLWPTKTTKHNISASPYKDGKGDIVGELAAECRKQKLKFGVYLSPWDRNNPLYGTPEYVTRIYREQLRELLTWYGPIFETWHDGANGGDGYYGGKRESRHIDRTTYYDWPTTWQLIRELQPDACVWSDIGWDARWVGTERGFAGDPCWHTITIGPKDGVGQMDEKKLLSGMRDGKSWIPAEVDFSIRPGWFWHEAQNKAVKSPDLLRNHYFESVGRGAAMLLNVPPDRRGLIHEIDASSLKLFGAYLKKTFAKNLAQGAKLTASNVRPGSDPKHLLDGNRETAWYVDDDIRTPELVIDLGAPKTFNVIRLREAIWLGQRIDEVAVDSWQDGTWRELASAQSVGACRLWRTPITTTNKLRVRVKKAAACPALSDFGLFLEAPIPNWSPLGAEGPGASPKTARATVVACSSEAEGGGASANLLDGNPTTLWHTHSVARGESGLPQWVVLDLGARKTVTGFTYLPRQDGTVHGMVDRYALYLSQDGKSWGEPVAEGEFGNLRANPVEQTVRLATPTTGRFVKFVALHALEKNHVAIAGLGILADPR